MKKITDLLQMYSVGTWKLKWRDKPYLFQIHQADQTTACFEILVITCRITEWGHWVKC